jgi:D-alanyl-D-alanine carboxypeptidase
VTDDPTRLQKILDNLVEHGELGALARFQDDDHTWAGSSGVAELGTARPVAAHGWFRIGSVTKAFTATVLLQLVGEGAIRLDDSVEHWLPGLIPGGGAITVGHLARHTSGLHNYTDDMSDAAVVLKRRFSPDSPREIVGSAARQPRLFPVGERRSYANTNYIVLGMVIEKCTANSYGAEIQRRILRPAGMTNTLAGCETATMPEPHARGYLALADELVDITQYSPAWAWSAGGIVSTAEDLNRFYAVLLTGGLVHPEQLRTMQETVPTADPSMAAGLGIARVSLPDGSTVWGNGGGFYGYNTWSFHTRDGRRQFSASATTGASPRRPVTSELLTAVFCSPSKRDVDPTS